MEYELGSAACEFYLVSKEEFESSTHQKWLWIDFFVIIIVSLVFVSVYFVAVPPNLTFEDLESS